MAILHLPASPALQQALEDKSALERRWRWLYRVEDLVKTVALGGEGRIWLCAALGSLDLPPSARKAAFLGLVSADGDEGRSVCERVVRMVCEYKPAWAARVIARDDRLLRRFFDGDSKRILQWFGKFSTGGHTDHQWGARALARYTFVNRDSCWQELDWKGRHGQAPATVASKPHYFLELDVLRTVDNFLDNVPSFWKSEELWETLKDGEFISLDVDYFTRELVEKMLVDDCPDTWNLIEDYLAEESLSRLSNCVLHLLSEESLLSFVNELVFQLSKVSRLERRGTKRTTNWLQEVISSGEKCKTLYDAIICNACTNHRRQVLNIIRDEDHEGEAETLKLLLSEVETDSRVVWAVRWENLKADKWICMKRLGLESWFLYAYLTERSQEVCYPTLFRDNRIAYDAPPVTPKKRKKSKKSRKRYRDNQDSGSSSSDDGEGNALEDKSWKLCTDNFSFLWRKEDLPEHLSGYAFEECVKWVVSHW